MACSTCSTEWLRHRTNSLSLLPFNIIWDMQKNRFLYVLYFFVLYIVLYCTDVRITESRQSCMKLLSNRSNVNAWTLCSTIILNLYVTCIYNLEFLMATRRSTMCLHSLSRRTFVGPCIPLCCLLLVSTYPPNCRQPHQNGSVLFLLPCPATGT